MKVKVRFKYHVNNIANGIEIILLYFGSIPTLYKQKIKKVSKIKAEIPTTLNLINSFEIFFESNIKILFFKLVKILNASNFNFLYI